MFFESILIFILSLAFIYLIRKYASKIGLVDVPNERSVHVDSVPRAAGIGFFSAVALVVPLFHFDLIVSYPWTLLAILLIFIVDLIVKTGV